MQYGRASWRSSRASARAIIGTPTVAERMRAARGLADEDHRLTVASYQARLRSTELWPILGAPNCRTGLMCRGPADCSG
jgi:hypothetical protein